MTGFENRESQTPEIVLSCSARSFSIQSARFTLRFTSIDAISMPPPRKVEQVGPILVAPEPVSPIVTASKKVWPIQRLASPSPVLDWKNSMSDCPFWNVLIAPP